MSDSTDNNEPASPPETPAPVVVQMYHLEIQDGNVFAGTIKQFEDNFFLFPTEISDEDKIEVIRGWVYEQGWQFKYSYLH